MVMSIRSVMHAFLSDNLQVDIGTARVMRPPNNKRRKRLYKRVFNAMDFGELERGERRRLPHCVCAVIRQVYPDETGCYMEFKDQRAHATRGSLIDH